MTVPPRVFISYSHDSDAHKDRVLRLSNNLRDGGVDCHLDRYETFTQEGWPRWMSAQIDSANYVLVICTETYKRRATGEELPGVGLGVSWEGMFITQEIYNKGGRNTKFIPVIFTQADAPNVPKFLTGYSRFCIETTKGLEELYRFLTSQPAVVKPPVGPMRQLALHSSQEPSDSKPFEKSKEPIVIWRLPRGFILFCQRSPEIPPGAIM